jgi:cyclopropane-fatty-acyl-phospholipid synthase
MKSNIIPGEYEIPARRRASVLQSVARRAILKRLDGIRDGYVELADGAEIHRFGTREAGGLMARIDVHDPQFYADFALGGSVGAGEGYIYRTWDCDDLAALVRILVRNKDVLYGIDNAWARLTQPALNVAHALNRNSLAGSRKNIAAHYDLGNDLFSLFLDETMMYSCAIFAPGIETLKEASDFKNDLICRKLDLGPADHLLEIGTGWGGFAIHAARHYGCRVTTTTISKEQHALARERIIRAGLTDRITLLLDDYRDLQGQYDKLVSIEMIEAVGHQYLDAYFRRCSELLKPNGLMLLQAITINDQQYEAARKSVDFIKRFIFPGSFLPSVTCIADTLTRVTDMRVFHIDDIGPHYAETLRHWRSRFKSSKEKVLRLGYPESFVRMWEFYLCYCEGGFDERHISDVQMLLSKPGNRRAPLVNQSAVWMRA